MTDGLFQRAEDIYFSPLDTSARPATFLAQLPNGRQLQISETIYHLLDCLSTPKSLDQLVLELHERTTVMLNEAQIRHVINEMLIPYQLLRLPYDSSSSAHATAASVLALHLRRDLISAKRLTPITRRLTWLFSPLVVAILLVLIGIVHAIIYIRLGSQPHHDSALRSIPQVYLLFLASIVFHELGHLSSCQRWGCPHGALGVGMYFLSPVFYADVSPAWKLSRWQRVVVDSAGVYFQQICTIPLAILYLVSSSPSYLWAIVAIDIVLLININPLAKFDGYWLLSDALGVPNLHQRVGEMVGVGIVWLARRLGLTTKRRDSSPFLSQLPRWTSLALTGYAIILLIFVLMFAVFIVPLLLRLALSKPAEILATGQQLVSALRNGAVAGSFEAIWTLCWNILLAFNIGVLLIRPIDRMFRRRARSRRL